MCETLYVELMYGWVKNPRVGAKGGCSKYTVCVRVCCVCVGKESFSQGPALLALLANYLAQLRTLARKLHLYRQAGKICHVLNGTYPASL